MKDRLDKITRIVRLQKQMRRVAEWRLIELEQQERELRDQVVELISSLNEDAPLHGLFIDSMSKRLTSLGIERGAVVHARDDQAERVRAETRKLRTAERMEGVASTEAERHDQKRYLEEVVSDALVRRAYGLDPSSRAD